MLFSQLERYARAELAGATYKNCEDIRRSTIVFEQPAISSLMHDEKSWLMSVGGAGLLLYISSTLIM